MTDWKLRPIRLSRIPARGFFVAATWRRAKNLREGLSASIPRRGFLLLQHVIQTYKDFSLKVSIPRRGFLLLQPVTETRPRLNATRFQSPGGDFCCCNGAAQRVRAHRAGFQSPGGDFCCCNAHIRITKIYLAQRFNPPEGIFLLPIPRLPCALDRVEIACLHFFHSITLAGSAQHP
jgi:hypothetical protein